MDTFKIIILSIIVGYLLKIFKTTPINPNPLKWDGNAWFDFAWISLLIFFVLAAASGNYLN